MSLTVTSSMSAQFTHETTLTPCLDGECVLSDISFCNRQLEYRGFGFSHKEGVLLYFYSALIGFTFSGGFLK